MPRRRPDLATDHADAIDRLLASLDTASTEAAAIAFRSALKRQGRDLAQVGGIKAMREVLEQVATSNARQAALLDAWDGIPGWHLGAAA